MDDATEAAEDGADDDGQQLRAVGVEAEHRGAWLVLADGGHGVAGPGADEQRHGTPGDDDETERQPVAVGRIRHADEQLGHRGPVEGLALLAAGGAAGVAHHDDRRRLGEGQVTIAKAIPPTRNAMAPTTSASSVVPARASSAANGSGSDHDDSEIVRR